MRISKKKVSLFFLLLVSDTMMLLLSCLFAFYLRFFIFESLFIYQPIDSLFTYKYISTLKFMIPLWLIIINVSKNYKHFSATPMDEFARTIKVVSIFILCCIVFSFLVKGNYSRSIFVFIWINLIVFMFFSRQLFQTAIGYVFKLLNKRNHILMIGKNVKKYRDIFKNNPINKVFYFPFILKLTDLEKVESLILRKQIKQLIIVDHAMSDTDILSFYDWAEYNDVIFKVLPSEIQICRGEILVDSALGIPVFQFISNSLTGIEYFFKRLLDIIISLSALILLSPFLLLLFIIIKLESKGNIIYTQIRQGYRGKPFKFYKFRSMVCNADEKLDDVKSDFTSKDEIFFKVENDPRITKVGAFIRKYSIDEIPQLFNVLKGDMSLVGPRPLVLWEARQVEEAFYSKSKKRLRVLPGITGLWQVSGRSLLSDEKRIDLDVFYVEHWSFGLDLKILFKTVWVVLFPRGSY
ncbi:MAG: exopolysaccharide biosynthesis polyprenyl glycosylphosphotransferase [Endomicrobiaceae bacterium]|nr:exopolysaccharide biosynthesis polyprenyl glycosylphosphotransferase [Endomicrobiaceae bacterium]